MMWCITLTQNIKHAMFDWNESHAREKKGKTRCTIQCVPEKRKPINRVNFSENLMIYQKKFKLLQNSVYPLSFDTRYKMYWPCMSKYGPFQMVMSKMICAEWEFKGLTGSERSCFRTKGRVEKTFISISFVSFVMFLLLRLRDMD